jgi:hypothetical protein
LQRLVKARLRAVYCRVRLQLLGMGARKWRAQSICSALVRRFTTRKFTAAAGDALMNEAKKRGCTRNKAPAEFYENSAIMSRHSKYTREVL